MPSPFVDARALTEALVRSPSVSPDRSAENACARVWLTALPPRLEHGAWETRDGRQVPWARVRGTHSGAPALLLLGHHDTVDVAEYGALGADGGAGIAFDPAGLLAWWRSRSSRARRSGPRAAILRADLAEEARTPGTWVFGRGALDMKAGLAAGAAALERLAARPPGGDVWMVSCPDEEHTSAGMLTAIVQLAGRVARDGARFAGALNLDYAQEPAGFAGVMGKARVGLLVLGKPTHAGAPFDGVDAAQLGAAIVARATASPAFADVIGDAFGPPAVVLQMRDLKPRYDLQTAAEAEIQLNVLSAARPIETTIEALRTLAIAAIADTRRAMERLRKAIAPAHLPLARGGGEVLTWPELCARCGEAAERLPGETTLERARRLARIAGLDGPAVVVFLLPPFYPPSPPGGGALVRAAGAVLAKENVPLRPWYPYVSDASYLAWRGEPVGAIARHLPAWGEAYELPVAAMTALDLDVVNLGPWGRDAHGVAERVHAPWAFERLPRLIEAIARATLDDAGA